MRRLTMHFRVYRTALLQPQLTALVAGAVLLASTVFPPEPAAADPFEQKVVDLFVFLYEKDDASIVDGRCRFPPSKGKKGNCYKAKANHGVFDYIIGGKNVDELVGKDSSMFACSGSTGGGFKAGDDTGVMHCALRTDSRAPLVNQKIAISPQKKPGRWDAHRFHDERVVFWVKENHDRDVYIYAIYVDEEPRDESLFRELSDIAEIVSPKLDANILRQRDRREIKIDGLAIDSVYVEGDGEVREPDRVYLTPGQHRVIVRDKKNSICRSYELGFVGRGNDGNPYRIPETIDPLDVSVIKEILPEGWATRIWKDDLKCSNALS